MKTYFRKHVAHEIYVALTHFKNLQPMMDRYGKKQNNKSKPITLTPFFNKYSKCHCCISVQFTMMERQSS